MLLSNNNYNVSMYAAMDNELSGLHVITVLSYLIE